MFTNEFMRNLAIYISVYLFGLWGLGLTSITVCIILTIILIHVDTILKKNEKTKTTSPPWWIEDSSVSRCEWLNEILAHTWTHFQSYLQQSFPIMLDEIEVLSKLKKYGICSATLKSLDLGQFSPRIDGTKLVTCSQSEIVVDFKIKFAGVCHLDLEIVSLGSRSSGFSLKSVSALGIVRVKCCFEDQLVEVGLVSPPEVDFEFGRASSVLNIPGFYDIMCQLVVGEVERVCVLPNSRTFQVKQVFNSNNNNDAGVLDEPEGVLNITLVEARDLVNTDSRMLGQGVSDPYATISFLVDNTLNRVKTFIIKDNLNPEWNFLCQTPVEHLESVSDINIKLFDKDDFSKDDNLGEVSVPKSVIKRSSDQRAEQDFWLMLTNTEKGSVRTKVSWSTLSTTPTHHKDDQAVLVVHLHSCTNIVSSKSTMRPDLVVSASVNNKTKVSSKISDNNNPIFEDRLLLLVNNPTVDDLKLDVVDIKNDCVAGSVNIELSTLLSRDSLQMIDENMTLINKGTPTSGSIRFSLALRYLHHTAKLATPVILDKTHEENIFDLQSSSEQDKLSAPREQIENELNIRKSIKDLKESVKDLQNLMIEDVKPKPISTPKVAKKGIVEKKIVKSHSVGGSLNGKAKARNGLGNGVKKESGPRIYLTVKYNNKTSVVSLIVHKVVNLQEITSSNAPNPYIKTYLLETLFSSHKRDVHSKKKTKTKKGTFNPVFEDTIEYYIPSHALASYRIEVEVCSHKTVVSKMMSLGRCLVDLRGLEKSVSVTNCFSLRQTVVDRRASLPK